MNLKVFTCSILVILFICLILCNTSFALVSDESYDALVETAKAFYARGQSAQYDDCRKDTWYTPEQGTFQHTIYSTCSYFIYKVYTQAFNNLENKIWLDNARYMQYAREYYNAYENNVSSNGLGKYILSYVGSTDEIYSQDAIGSSYSSVQQYINYMAPLVKIGDIFATQPINGGTGHVVLVLEINKIDGDNWEIIIIESGGTNYDISSLKEKMETVPYQGEGKGTYRITNLKDRLNEHVDAYNNGTNKTLEEIAWIRFLNDDNTFLDKNGNIGVFLEDDDPISYSALTRTNYPSLFIEKTASVPTNSYVDIGQVIDYTIFLKNDSQYDYSDPLYVFETIDWDLVDLESSIYTINIGNEQYIYDIDVVDDSLSFYNNILLNAQDSMTITYSVRVKDDPSLYGESIFSSGKVGNIYNAEIIHCIGKSLTSTQKELLCNNLVAEGQNMEYIVNVYKNALGIDLTDYVDIAINDYIETYKNNNNTDNGVIVWLRDINDIKLKRMTVSNFFGEKVLTGSGATAPNRNWSVNTNSTRKEFNGRAKYIIEDDLQIGDIILWNVSSGQTYAYMYIGNSTLVRSNTAITSGISTDSKYAGLNYSNMQIFLDDLVFKDYMIIRPAMMNNEKFLGQSYNLIIDLAKNYTSRTEALRYGSRALTYQIGNYYKTINNVGRFYAPEEVTSQYPHYFVCSIFVNNLYSEAFSKSGDGYRIKGKDSGRVASSTSELIQVAKSGTDFYNDDISICYYEKIDEEFLQYYVKYNDYMEEQNPEGIEVTTNGIASQINEILKVGDLIVYTYGGSGHVVVYIGNGMICESRGGEYNMQNRNTASNSHQTMEIRSLDTLLSSTDLFKPTTDRIAVLRPLNEIEELGYAFSPNSLRRLDHPGLYTNMLSSVESFESLNPGEIITYSINITNESSNDYEDICGEAFIPNNTSLVSKSFGESHDGTLTFSVDIPANSTCTFTYTVRVTSDKSILGNYIINENAKVDDLSLNTIKTKINRTFKSEAKDSLIDRVNSLEGISYSSSEDFLNDVFEGVNFPETNDLLNALFDKSSITLVKGGGLSNGINHTYLADTYNIVGEKEVFILKDNVSSENQKFKDMYVEGLYGGLFTIPETDTVPGTVDKNDGRCVTFSNRTFSVGDILVLYDDSSNGKEYVAGEKNMYLYIGDYKFATVDKGFIRIIEGDTLFIRGDDGKVKTFNVDSAARLMDSLIGQHCFIVLRPSFYEGCNIAGYIPGIKGDYNKNQVIDINDVRTLLLTYLNYPNVEVFDINDYDFDLDSNLTINDIRVLLMQYINQ